MKGRLLGAAFVVIASAPFLEAHKPTKTTFTYHKDVFPIFERRCGSCHREGGVGPMSLLRYKETFPWAVSIKNQVLSLSMPPWFADERYGSFQHSASLTATEVNTIVDWCLGGTPEGDPGDAATRADAHAVIEPDLVLELKEPFILTADRAEAHHEALLPTALGRDRILRSIEFRPEQPNVVRSAVFFVAPKGKKPGAPTGSWIAGEGTQVWPEGTGVRLPAGASLLVRIHYKKTWLTEGKEIRDRSALALSFASKKAEPIESVLVVESGVYPLSRDVEVVSMLPSIEAPVESLLAEAVLPDGTTRPLLRLLSPDAAWPRTYRLEEPVLLPKGSRLRVTAAPPLVAPAAAALIFNIVRN
jgi:hypothetical protein